MYVDARSERMRSGGCIYSWMPDSGDSTKLLLSFLYLFPIQKWQSERFLFFDFSEWGGSRSNYQSKTAPKRISFWSDESFFEKKGGDSN